MDDATAKTVDFGGNLYLDRIDPPSGFHVARIEASLDGETWVVLDDPFGAPVSGYRLRVICEPDEPIDAPDVFARVTILGREELEGSTCDKR